MAGLGAEVVLGREGVVWWEVKQLDGAMVADGQPKRQEHETSNPVISECRRNIVNQ